MTNSYDFGKLLANIRSKLPLQNPLHSFVHNNILQMYESLDFHDALREAGALYRAQTYWPIERYKELYAQRKIGPEDIMQGLDHYLGYKHELPFLTHLGLGEKDFFYRLMFSELNFNDDTVQPDIEDERLWAICREKLKDSELVLSRSPVIWRARSYWEKHYNILFPLSIHPLITRLTGSYLDQGQSFWSNPFTQEGFWKFVSYDLDQTKNFLSGWQKLFAGKMKKYEGMESPEIIIQELRSMNLPEEIWESYLLDILFDLKGWAGMVNKLEVEPWQATVKAPSIKLTDYIAVLLLIENSVDTFLSESNSLDISLIRGRKEDIRLSGFNLSLALYQITKNMKLETRWAQRLNREEVLSVIDGVDQAEHKHNICLWHEAFEHHYYRHALGAIVSRSPGMMTNKPSAQILFCIDDREESIRRHIEEVNSDIATFGVVGFFGIDMKFSSIKHDRLISQCPPVVKPSKIVTEVPLDNSQGAIWKKVNKFLGISDLAFYYQSRTLFRGILSTLVLGTLSVIPMFLQVFFPSNSGKIKRYLFNLMSAEPRTIIDIEKRDELHGYDIPEMANIVKSILDQCGIRDFFSPVIVLLAHGSSSTNNPFRQAYGCGACGGNAGIPNSRAFAKMANDPRVREKLSEVGVKIPPTTAIISGFHDTCADEVSFFDLESISSEHLSALENVRNILSEALRRNALERCQRFSLKSARKNPGAAIRHVKERALDPAQPRPEYGHSKNALAIVARRDLTKGLFLNRRAFLHTYDWRMDPDGKILAQVVAGGVPVACNINMDYYFSLVDNENFGCGSKLPLNLTSLLGVMTGSQGDLRIGLARQMVEIHEPIRNMTIIEAPFERVRKLFAGHPRLRNIQEQHWLRLVVHDPETDRWILYSHGKWNELQLESSGLRKAASSLDLLPDVRSLDFAEIG